MHGDGAEEAERCGGAMPAAEHHGKLCVVQQWRLGRLWNVTVCACWSGAQQSYCPGSPESMTCTQLSKRINPSWMNPHKLEQAASAVVEMLTEELRLLGWGDNAICTWQALYEAGLLLWQWDLKEMDTTSLWNMSNKTYLFCMISLSFFPYFMICTR